MQLNYQSTIEKKQLTTMLDMCRLRFHITIYIYLHIILYYITLYYIVFYYIINYRRIYIHIYMHGIQHIILYIYVYIVWVCFTLIQYRFPKYRQQLLAPLDSTPGPGDLKGIARCDGYHGISWILCGFPYMGDPKNGWFMIEKNN